jgi:hypothetical protein
MRRAKFEFGEMRRTPRGGQWYAKSVSNLLARA